MTKRTRIRYADVAATFALVIAMSTGGAFAAGQIGSNGIANNAIKSRHIANGQVKTPDLKDNAVKSAKVKDGSLTGNDVADGSLSSDDLGTSVKGVAMAGVTVASDGTIVQSFNRVGGAITASNPSTGTYSVTIPGAAFTGFTSVLSSINGSVGNYCYVNNGSASTLELRCRTFADALTNTTVNFVLYRDSTGSTAPRPGAGTKADAR
jgi:hypothetical protein